MNQKKDTRWCFILKKLRPKNNYIRGPYNTSIILYHLDLNETSHGHLSNIFIWGEQLQTPEKVLNTTINKQARLSTTTKIYI